MTVLNPNIFCSYNVISNLLIKFGLTVEHGKLEVFPFSRLQGMLWQPLDQCPIVALQVNLLGGYLVENTSCVIHKRTQQRTTTVLY